MQRATQNAAKQHMLAEQNSKELMRIFRSNGVQWNLANSLESTGTSRSRCIRRNSKKSQELVGFRTRPYDLLDNHGIPWEFVAIFLMNFMNP